MGLFKKIKDILFEEEEYTEQIKITPEMRNEETPLKEEKVVEKKEAKVETPKPKVEPVATPQVSEREIFQVNTNYPFLDFDEEEFDHQRPVTIQSSTSKTSIPEKRQSNVIEYERKKKIEKRYDFGRYEKTETTEITEKRKFKPSPIISPVYGILNKDYDKNDILQRDEVQKVDIKTVRDKAFGEKNGESYKPKVTTYEENETVTIAEPTETKEKVKTIDELLESTSDVIVDLDKDITASVDDLIPDEPSDTSITQELKTPVVDDTLENDLFELIDSMYDSKEDGEL